MTRKVWSKWPCKMDINSRAYCKTRHVAECGISTQKWKEIPRKGSSPVSRKCISVSWNCVPVSRKCILVSWINIFSFFWKPGHIFGKQGNIFGKLGNIFGKPRHIFGKQGHNFEKIGIHSPDTGIHFREIVCYRVGYLLIQFFTEVEKKLTRRKIRPARKVARETHSINIVSLW